MMEQFRQKTIASFSWQGAAQILSVGLRFVFGVVLARLLSPSEFGLVAMATVLSGYAEVVGNFGLGAALIQRQELGEMELSSAFWLNVFVGLVLSVGFILVAPLISDFYGEPVLLPITVSIGLTFVISSTRVVHNVQYKRELNFKYPAISQVTGLVVSNVIAVAMALLGKGVWSLVAQAVLAPTIWTLMLWKFNSWRPKFIFDWPSLRKLLGFSGGVLGVDTLNYWTENIDNLLIGRFLGSGALGIYVRAYALMLLPVSNTSRVLSQVLFSSFSRIQDDRVRVKRIYLRMTRLVGMIVIPFATGLLITSQNFVFVVYGEKWMAMVPVLQVLCLISIVRVLELFNRNLFLSQGKSSLLLRLDIFLKGLTIAGIVIGLRWGIYGVAIGYSIFTIIGFFPNFYFSGKLVGLGFVDLYRNLSGIILCVLIMGFLTWGIGMWLNTMFRPFAVLLMQISLGIGIYLFSLHIFNINSYLDLREIIHEQIVQRKLGRTS